MCASLPRHVVIIPDGNRRWAKVHNVSLREAYERGIRKFQEVAQWGRDAGVEVLTFWAFSTENAKRGKEELDILFSLFDHYLSRALEEMRKRDGERVEVRFLGRLDMFPEHLQRKMRVVQERFSDGKRKLVFLMGYGGRDEILHAVNRALHLGLKEVNEQIFSSLLYTVGLPDPDLLIRTSGEQRLSGCLPWQTVYTELYFCPKLWPDFEKEDLISALEEYKKRKRRFGR